MSDERKYVRVYYSVVNDERFDEIYHDPRRFGTWLQLLLIADAMYPAEAPVPAYVHKASMKALVDCGLVELRAHQHFVMHGLASEREMRGHSGRNAAAVRWQSERNADPMPRQDKQSKDEHRQAEPSNGRADALDAYWTLLGKYPNGRTKTWIEELVNEFDDERVSAALAVESKGDRQGILGRVRDRLRSEADKTEKAKAAAETQRLEAEAIAKRITPEQAAENQRRVREELRKMGVGREA